MAHVTNDTASSIVTGDVEIGAVELKNATTDDRAKIAATGSIAEGNNALAVHAPVLGASDGAAITADGSGTLQQYLRSLLKATGWYDDAAATSTGTLSAKLRGILTAIGATDGAKVVTDANGTVQQYLRGLVSLASGWTVNTGAVAGTVTANAGSNLNTSSLALESSGHLEETADHCHSIDGKLPAALGVQAVASSMSIVTAKRQHLGSGVVVAVGAVTAASTQLSLGRYRLTATCDCWIKQGASTVTAAANSTNPYLAAGAIEEMDVDNTTNNGYVAVIQDGAQTGYLSICPI
jgi:hypothetical protein